MTTPPQSALAGTAPLPNFALPPPLLGTPSDAAASSASSAMLHPVAAMLSREAQAWNALAALHGQILASAQTATPQHDELSFSEKVELLDQRTAHYIAALSQLAANCDALNSEALRARGLRRARHQVERTSVDEVLRTHTLETLASGAEVGKSMSMSLAGVTAELRASSAHSRQQIAQTRTLLEALKDSGPLKPGVEMIVGLRQSNGAECCRRVGDVLSELQRAGGDVTAERIVAALEGAGDDNDAHDAGGRAAAAPAASSHKTFARRSGDRVNSARRKTPLESD